MTDAIKVEKLVKKFNGFTAVDSISFTVKSGELFGLLGPNGAGKTTTINMLSTLLKASAGKADVADHDISKEKDEVRNSIGIVFQEPALDLKLTGRENLEFHSMIYGMGKEERRKRIKEVLNLVELTDKADTLVEKYSGGMKRRLEIARGLVHKPKVLFLDEPTLGLDTQTRRRIWEYIKKLNRESGVTIILTTHYMEEADFLCERIAIMDHGKIVALDTPKRLKDILGGDVVVFEIEGNTRDALTAHLKKLKWIKMAKKCEEGICLTLSHAETKIPELVNIAQKMGTKIKSVNLHKPSLEDVFLHFTGRTIRDQESNQSGMSMMMRARMGMRR